ncbi:MAG TPA: cation-transporting P-type ATPase, partial [Candidatus Eisenbacteria bacterium]|nr:cation-transporting P-type ATPase [Candidatus Eisenbacteria bacterium]
MKAHAMTAEETARHLCCDPERGLSEEEAARRLAADGANVLEEPPPPSRWSRLASQFRDVVVWVLLAAAGISFALGDLVDSVVILAIVVLNAALG